LRKSERVFPTVGSNPSIEIASATISSHGVVFMRRKGADVARCVNVDSVKWDRTFFPKAGQ
jgi:hypothetical protein